MMTDNSRAASPAARTWFAVVVVVSLLMTGCGRSIPSDPDHTLDRVRGTTLRVGVSLPPPWTELSSTGAVSGREVDLVEGFAEELGAEVIWVPGGEEQLVTAMEHQELDLLIGGLTADTPWADKVAVTRPYLTTAGPRGETIKLVMAAPLGENAFLRSLESYLHAMVPA